MISFQREVAGRTISIETGRIATQADGAVIVRYGDTVVLATVCSSDEPREGIDFLPLTVDYEERLYAAGKIPGGFIRREGRPSQEATLTARLTDRPVRPLLPKKWRKDIQIIVTVLSTDQENDPAILSVIGSSAALSISQIPFEGPISGVHVGYIDGKLTLNPTLLQLETSPLDLVIVSSKKAVVMVEAGAQELAEDIVMEAIRFGHQANQDIISLQEQLREACGKPKVEAPPDEIDPALVAAVSSAVDEKIASIMSQLEKTERHQELRELKKEAVQSLGESFTEGDIVLAFEGRVKAGIRDTILNQGRRIDGRGLSEVRPISCEVGLLPRTHGSGLFNRGETQVLTITTLGSAGKEQKLDGLGINESRRFMHHYNFPPFSTGEVRRVGSPGRREIGHGALAERAIEPVLPKDEDFPYTIRLVSEVLGSSGSTSMASVCASSLSLMDAGIPIKRAVSGIAMGLVSGKDGDCTILTDIEGIEDACGDMDFKIAGTTEGITAIQLDIKLKGVDIETLEKALKQAREARLHILDVMQQTINSYRPEVSRYAPRIYKIMVDPDKIGAIIGTGGKTIRAIQEQSKATIDIEDNGAVLIGATDEESANKAIEMIRALTEEVEIGTIYTGKVTRLFNFGAMVEILPGKEGMVHISELADYRVASVEDIVKVGDEVTVKVIDIDNMGRVNLSRKAVFEKTPTNEGPRPRGAPSSERPFRRQREGR
ncbi:polyribonucleotide nucleotidyltransferase [Chloroflexota bacterium]